MAREPFVWGQGGAQLTPRQLEERRKVALALMAKGADFSPAGHWTEALGRAFNGWWGGKQAGQFNRQEEEATAAARAKMEGRYSASPVATALAGGVGGGGAAPTGNSFMDSLVKSESGGNWNALNSEGYGGRLQFGEARLADAARAGIIPAGMTGAEFSRLSPEQQMAVEQWHFADIDRQAAAMGLDQFIGQTVAGIPITQDAIRGMAHLGGIGGAAKFLQTGGAYNPSDSNGTSLADYAARHGGAPSVATGTTSNEIYSLMADPWVMDQYGSVLGSELAGVQQRENAIFNQQLAMQDPMYQMGLEQKRLELEAMKNPGKKPPIQVGDVLLDPDTLQPVYDGRLPATPEAPETQVFYDEATGQEYRAQWNPATMTWDRVGGVKAGAPPDAPVTKNVTLSDGSEVMVQWNPEKRVWDAAPIPEGGTLGTGGGAGLTESQAKTTLFATLQNETAPVLSQIESIWDPANISDAAARSTPIAGNFFKSEQGQIYDAGAAAWAEGALRISTGAAATEPEIARVKQTYFAQPGDTPNVVEFKRQMREMYSRAIQASLGNPAAGAATLTLPEDFAKRYMSTNPMPADTSTTEVIPDGIDPAEWEYMTPEEKALFQ